LSLRKNNKIDAFYSAEKNCVFFETKNYFGLSFIVAELVNVR